MKTDMINTISFHDSDVTRCELVGNDLFLEFNDGWLSNVFYKLKIYNIKVEVMNVEKEYICYLLDEFNDVKKYNVNLYAGEAGNIDKFGNICYLKLWIRHPDNFGIEPKITMKQYKFQGKEVSLCDDIDDTGGLYIKFIFNKLDLEMKCGENNF